MVPRGCLNKLTTSTAVTLNSIPMHATQSSRNVTHNYPPSLPSFLAALPAASTALLCYHCERVACLIITHTDIVASRRKSVTSSCKHGLTDKSREAADASAVAVISIPLSTSRPRCFMLRGAILVRSTGTQTLLYMHLLLGVISFFGFPPFSAQEASNKTPHCSPPATRNAYTRRSRLLSFHNASREETQHDVDVSASRLAGMHVFLCPFSVSIHTSERFHGSSNNRRTAITSTPQRACCHLHDYKQQTNKAESRNHNLRNDIITFPTCDLKTTTLVLVKEKRRARYRDCK
jgi:hypothetical protein